MIAAVRDAGFTAELADIDGGGGKGAADANAEVRVREGGRRCEGEDSSLKSDGRGPCAA